jgi:hypothetical protein
MQSSNPAAYEEQLRAILGSCTIRTNQAEYPEDYDNTLNPSDEGYIEPQWADVDDSATLSRLGFNDRAAVEAALAALS